VDDHYQPPRLRILHLLIWTAVAAVLLKCALKHDQLIRTVEQVEHAHVCQNLGTRAIGSALDILFAACLVGLGVLVISRLRGGSGRLQPGHWVLVAEGCVIAFVVPLVKVLRLVEMSSTQSLFPARWFTLTVVGVVFLAILCRGGVYLLAAYRTRDGRRWRACFLLLGVVALFMAMDYADLFLSESRKRSGVSYISFDCANVLLCLVALVAALGGLRAGRDWLHWLGLVVLGGVPALEIAWETWLRSCFP
jgi:hypothetical protein